MISIEAWTLRRAHAFASALVPEANRTIDVLDPAAWQALARDAEQSARGGPSSYLLAGPFEAIASSLHAGGDVCGAVSCVYEAAGALLSPRGGRDHDFASGEARRQALDPTLLAAMGAVDPPPRFQAPLVRALVERVQPDLGRARLSADDAFVDQGFARVGRKLLARSVALADDPARQARVDLVWTVLVPLVRDPGSQALGLASRALALFDAGLPVGFAEPGLPAADELSGADALLPVLRAIALGRFSPFGPEAKACVKAGVGRSAILVGIAQLVAGLPSGWRPDDPVALEAHLRALTERLGGRVALTPAERDRLASLPPPPHWLSTALDAASGSPTAAAASPPRKKRAATPPDPPEVEGLRGGALLWPLVRCVQQPDWIGWRSDRPECAALSKAPASVAGHVKAGIHQLLADPPRWGIHAPDRRAALIRTLRALELQRKRWFATATLDAADLAAIDAAGPQLPDQPGPRYSVERHR